MKILQEQILETANKIYKESVLLNSVAIQELLLSLLVDIKRLSEFNEPIAKKTRERLTLDKVHGMDINIIAYIFSEYEHNSLFPNKTQQDAIKEVSYLIKVKKNTFKNKRDAYDKYTNSNRKGWDKELSESLQIIFDEYKELSMEESLVKAKNILGKYKE